MQVVSTTWVEDLGKFQRDLAKIEPGLRDEFRDALRPVGGDIAATVRSAMPYRTGAARGSVRSSVTNKGAYVAEGGRRVPYVGWLDFGGVLKPTGRRRNTITRAVIRGGRYMYPAIERNQLKIVAAARGAVESSARKAGWRK